MVVFVLIINHIIKNKNYENYTLLYIYIQIHIESDICICIEKTLFA